MQPTTYPHPRIPAVRLFFSTWGSPEVVGGDDFFGFLQGARLVRDLVRGGSAGLAAEALREGAQALGGRDPGSLARKREPQKGNAQKVTFKSLPSDLKVT